MSFAQTLNLIRESVELAMQRRQVGVTVSSRGLHELLADYTRVDDRLRTAYNAEQEERFTADKYRGGEPTLSQVRCARPLANYHEDFGPVLWWMFPVVEPPYCGGPGDEDWPGYHTHWTPILVPDEP